MCPSFCLFTRGSVHFGGGDSSLLNKSFHRKPFFSKDLPKKLNRY